MKLDVHGATPAARTSARPRSAPPARGRRPGCGRRRARPRNSILCRGFGVHQRSSTSHCSRTASTATPATASGTPSASAATSHRPRPVDLRPRAQSIAALAERGQDRPPLGDPRAGVDLDHPQDGVAARRPSAPGAPPRRAARGAPRRASAPAPAARRARVRARARAARARRRGRGARPAAAPAPAAAARGRRWRCAGRPPSASRRSPASRASSRSRRIVRPRRRGMGEQALDQQPERVRELLARGRLREAEPALDLLVRAPGAKRLVDPARQPQRPQPRLAEAVGDRRGGQLGELAQRPHPEPLERVQQVISSHPGLVLAAVRPARLGSARRPRSALTGRRASSRRAARSETMNGGRRARIRIAAAWALSRFGPAPSRAGAPSARRARARTASGPPQRARSGSVAKNASPGREGSTAAPIASSRRSDRSQAASARTGSAGTRTSAGQRESASASRIPARTPNASAAPEVSPSTCGPPGSGASATGRPSSSRRSPRALRSCRRGMRAQAMRSSRNRTHVRIGARGCQAGHARASELVGGCPQPLARSAVIATLVALAAIALAACGEKSEPDIADLTTTTAGHRRRGRSPGTPTPAPRG